MTTPDPRERPGGAPEQSSPANDSAAGESADTGAGATGAAAHAASTPPGGQPTYRFDRLLDQPPAHEADYPTVRQSPPDAAGGGPGHPQPDAAGGGGHAQPSSGQAGYAQPGQYGPAGYAPPPYGQVPYGQAPPAPPGYPPPGYAPPFAYGFSRARITPGWGLLFLAGAIVLFAVGFFAADWVSGVSFLDLFKNAKNARKSAFTAPGETFSRQVAAGYAIAAAFALAFIGVVQALIFSLGGTSHRPTASIAGRRTGWAVFQFILLALHGFAIWEIFNGHLDQIKSAGPWLVLGGALCLVIAAATGPILRRPS